jgi:hypothetical protein
MLLTGRKLLVLAALSPSIMRWSRGLTILLGIEVVTREA